MKAFNLTSLAFTSCLSLTMFSCVNARDNKKDMNVVIIVADDLGWADVGFHGSDILTPNLDKLAHEGVILDRFYVASISSPTRAGLMTGRYPTRFGIREVVIPPWRDFGLDVGEETMADMFAKAGYENRAIIGKWHLGHSKKKYHPLSRGFTHFYGHLNGAIDYFTLEREGQLDWHNDWESSYDKGYSTDLISEEAVKCVNNYSKDSSPFFLYVAYNAPHTPLQAKPEDIAEYTDNFDALTKKEQKRVTYSAMVSCMDKGIGRILDALKANGITDNTFVLFMSDNGGDPGGFASNLPLRGTKFDEWDGGVRVPAVISYPQKWQGNRTVEQVVGFVDIMPTLKELLNLRYKHKRPFDGIDISSILSGKKETIKRDFYLGMGAVVNNDYKYITAGKNPRLKLQEDFLSYYPSDSYESKNVSKEHASETKRLKRIAELYDSFEPAEKLPPYGEGKDDFVAPFEWKMTE